MKHWEWVFFIVVWAVMITAISALSGEFRQNSRLRSEAIARGYAQYCLNDGRWKWKSECESPGN